MYRGSAAVVAAAVTDGGAGDPDSSSSSTPDLSLGDALTSLKNLGKNISPQKFKSLRMLVLALVALVGIHCSPVTMDTWGMRFVTRFLGALVLGCGQGRNTAHWSL